MYMVLAADESIHSFLIRGLLCSGDVESIDDLTGIVSPSGVVRTLPKLNKKQRKCFEDVDVAVIDLGIAGHLPSFCQQPSIVLELREFVLGLRVPAFIKELPFSRTQLRYCIDCFKEQIHGFGHAWFKTTWLYEYDCEKHSKRLVHARGGHHSCCDKYLNTLVCIKSAFSGICLNCSCSNWEFAHSVWINKDWTGNYHMLDNPETEFYAWYDLLF